MESSPTGSEKKSSSRRPAADRRQFFLRSRQIQPGIDYYLRMDVTHENAWADGTLLESAKKLSKGDGWEKDFSTALCLFRTVVQAVEAIDAMLGSAERRTLVCAVEPDLPTRSGSHSWTVVLRAFPPESGSGWKKKLFSIVIVYQESDRSWSFGLRSADSQRAIERFVDEMKLRETLKGRLLRDVDLVATMLFAKEIGEINRTGT